MLQWGAPHRLVACAALELSVVLNRSVLWAESNGKCGASHRFVVMTRESDGKKLFERVRKICKRDSAVLGGAPSHCRDRGREYGVCAGKLARSVSCK